MTAVVVRGDAAHLPLRDGCVDLVICSPPYFGLRSYSDAGQHYDGQIGSESTPQEYLEALWACTAEWVRVLKPGGSIFVNLGDKYSTGASGQNGLGRSSLGNKNAGSRTAAVRYAERMNGTSASPPVPGFLPKSLLGLPWRYAIGCVDRLGLILRAEIVWCLSGGARVYARMPGGDRPIMLRDLVRSYRPENVQLWNGQQWTRVLGWNRSPDRDGALELELRTGERIGCTPGHRWPTQRGVIRADEIRVGDVIQTCRLPEPDSPAEPAGLNDVDTGWLVGLYLAEGSRSGQTLQFSGHTREEDRHRRLARIARAYHGTAAVYQTSENGATCNVTGAVLVGIIDHYIGLGRNARTKRLRRAAWQRNEIFLAAVMEGYLSGDGHFDAKNDRWRLGFTDNDEWAADLRTLAARLGAKLSLRRHLHQMGDRRFPGWRGEWRWTRSAHWNAKQDGEVVAIRVSRAREFYDVGVADEPHLFALASGVLTHNSKPNGLPESVTDRVRRSHEQVFHFVARPRYFSAVDEIREPQTGARNSSVGQLSVSGNGVRHRSFASSPDQWNPLGKLPGSVWSIPSSPLVVPERLGISHFAAYPPELVRRIVLGWSPPGVCTACGEGRRPVVPQEVYAAAVQAAREAAGLTRAELAERAGCGANNVWDYEVGGHLPRGQAWEDLATALGIELSRDEFVAQAEYVTTGSQDSELRRLAVRQGAARPYSERKIALRRQRRQACACPEPDAPARPAVVLDPFGGTGTTALVASAYGRVGVTVDRSGDYCRLAAWRVRDPGERARALGVPKPPPVPDGQGSLFDDEEAV